MWLTQRIRIFYWLNDEAKFRFVELNSISWIHLKCLQYARTFHCVLFIIFKKLMKNAFSARENPFTDFSLAFAKCFCSLAWLFQCKQTNLTGIRKCIKICSSGIYHLLVSMFRTHTHTHRETETHTHLYVAFMAYCNCSVDFSTTEAAEAVLPWQRFEIFYFCDIFGNLFPQQSVSQSVRESVTSSIWQSVVCLFALRVGHKLLWCLAMPQTNLDRLFVGNACRFRCSCLCCMQLPTPLQPVTTLCAALGVRALGDRAINTSVFKFNERLSPPQIKRCGRRRRPELGKYPACAGKSKSQTAHYCLPAWVSSAADPCCLMMAI